MPKRRVFISYHHGNDESYKTIFGLRFGNKFGGIIDRSVMPGDINPDSKPDTIRTRIRDDFIRDATVTVVLIGTETWKRKHVDWEIAASVRRTQQNSRCGLLGILLPAYQRSNGSPYCRHTIPPRLMLNVDRGYAVLHPWSGKPDDVFEWIDAAYNRRSTVDPDQSLPLFARNRSGARWYPPKKIKTRKGGLLDWLWS